MIELKVPGKLFIIGEYSITKSGNDAVLVSIDKYIHIKIFEAIDYQLESKLGRFKWMIDEESLPIFSYDDFSHAKSAIYIAHQYLKLIKKDIKVYWIDLQSDLINEENKKYGLGSSGAVMIAIIKGILKLHHVSYDNLLIFKLAVLAQVKIGDITSGGELAASIYTGWIYYKKYDLIWVLNHKGLTKELLDKPWPLLGISKLNDVPFKIGVCYSGSSQSTKEYVDIVNTKGNGNPWYLTFLNKTQLITLQFKDALINQDYNQAITMMNLYRNELLELQRFASITIEDEGIKKIIQCALSLNYGAKTSGAGGGDCIISLLPNVEAKMHIQKVWLENNFDVLDISVVDEND